ncbi:hypothetical protein [Infirmifilum sp.]|uniref:hypothetical protein n=1 Tax=Infirmifilum sp. TaxID=2856575 RepID=UPI003D111740
MELFKYEKEEELPAHEYFSLKIIDESNEIGEIVEKVGIKTEDIASLLIKV